VEFIDLAVCRYIGQLIMIKPGDKPYPIKLHLDDIDKVKILSGVHKCSGLICSICPYRDPLNSINGLCHEVNTLIEGKDWRKSKQ
jgi:hypothetical protein